MYFISQNNAVYNYIAHSNPLRRYCYTIAAVLVLLGSFYLLQLFIENWEHVYTQELTALKTNYKQTKKIERNNKHMCSLIDALKIKNKNSSGTDSSELLQTNLFFVLESARESGLILNSYTNHTEKDKQWHVKAVYTIDLAGSLQQIINFLHIIGISQKMIALSRWSLTATGENSFTFNGDITFLLITCA